MKPPPRPMPPTMATPPWLTTAPLTRSADTLFTEFKQQCYVEQGHHQWKTPLAVRPLFLKSPERVEALVYLLKIALTAYHLLQRLYRQAVPDDAPVAERRLTTRKHSPRLPRLSARQGSHSPGLRCSSGATDATATRHPLLACSSPRPLRRCRAAFPTTRSNDHPPPKSGCTAARGAENETSGRQTSIDGRPSLSASEGHVREEALRWRSGSDDPSVEV